MVQIIWSAPALDDLHEAYLYIAKDSRKYARATIERITDAAEHLTQWPEIGEVLADFPAYRQFVVGNYRLVYREDQPNQRVLIVGVIHGARDFPAAMRPRV